MNKSRSKWAGLACMALLCGVGLWWWHAASSRDTIPPTQPVVDHAGQPGPLVATAVTADDRPPGGEVAFLPARTVPGAGSSAQHALDRWAYAQRWPDGQPPELATFRSWTERYVAAGSAERATLEAEGVILARARRPVMRALISSRPRRALDLTAPLELRAQLPAAVVAELEVRTGGTGTMAVIPLEPDLDPAAEASDRSLPHEEVRMVSIDGVSHIAHVYGRRRAQATLENASLHGVALDGHMAVHESPLRILEPAETGASEVEPLNPLTGESWAATRPAPPALILVEVHGRTWRVDGLEALAEVERRLRRAENLPGPRVAPLLASGESVSLPLEEQAATAWSTGVKRLLVIRVDFSDVPGTPVLAISPSTQITTTYAGNVLSSVRSFYAGASYNQTSLQTLVSDTVYRMPRTAASYAQDFDLEGLAEDAKAAASAHYDVLSYDFVQLVFSYIGPSRIPGSKFGFGGIAYRGGSISLINGFYIFSVVAHEIGHNYGVAHANLWLSSSSSPLSNSGSSVEYGDIFDIMGSDASMDSRHHFNPWFKHRLGWLPDSVVTTVTASGTYRLQSFDTPQATLTQPLALHLFREGSRWFWISHRQSFTTNPSLANGAYVQWGSHSNVQSNLLDCGPEYGVADAGLALGSQLDDAYFGITMRPAGQGGFAPSGYLDVEITVDPLSRNIVAHWGEDEAMPVPVGLRDVTAIAAGDEHGLALLRNGNLVAWGDPSPEGSNRFGELATRWNGYGPIAIVAGGDSSGVIRADGTVMIWGVPDYGQNEIPAGLANVRQLAIGGDHVLALKHDGTVLAWGSNARGQIAVPAGLAGVKAVSAGRDMSLLVLENGSVLHLGVNADQLPAGLSGVVNVAAGWGHGLALKGDGTVVAWGDNSYGQTTVPSGLSGVKQIGAGHNHSVALKEDGTIMAWGSDEHDQRTVPRGLPRAESIAVAENHVLALIPGTNAPIVLTHPFDQAVDAGFSAHFHVYADSIGNPSYQWQRKSAGGTAWDDLADGPGVWGALTPNLGLQEVVYSMNGDQFRCRVGSEGSTVHAFSEPARLTVTPRPLVVTTQPSDRQGLLHAAATFTFAVSAEPPLTFRWQLRSREAAAWVDVTDGGGYSGAGTTSLSLASASMGHDGISFRCLVQDVAGQSAVSDTATLRVRLASPTVSLSPAADRPLAGATAVLNAPSIGPVPQTRQWRRNGVPIAGATDATLAIHDLTGDDEGWYDVVVSNGTGASITSLHTPLEVHPAQHADVFRPAPSFNPWFEQVGATVTIAIPGPDDTIYASGDFDTINGTPARRLVRLRADGSLDTSFRSPDTATGTISSLAVLPDGRLVIGGDFTTIDGRSRGRIARLHADGALDESFQPGAGFDRLVRVIAVQPDGRLVVGGDFLGFGGVPKRGLARLETDGSLDASFNPEDVVAEEDPRVAAIALLSDGRMMVGRTIPYYGGPRPGTLFRADASGRLDPTFVLNGYLRSLVAVAVQSDGRVYVAANLTENATTWSDALYRFHSDGTWDRTFRVDAPVPGIPTALALTDSGIVLASQREPALYSDTQPRLARLTHTGQLDPLFGLVTALNGTTHAIIPRSDGSIVIAGAFTAHGTVPRAALARLGPDASLDTAYSPTARMRGAVHTITPAGGGKWLVGGRFSHANGVACGNIVRLNADGSVDHSLATGQGFDGAVEAIARLPDGSFAVGGAFLNLDGQPAELVARLHPDGSRDSGFGLSQEILAWEILGLRATRSGGLLLAGRFEFRPDPGTYLYGMARTHLDGSVDRMFSPASGGSPHGARCFVELTDGRLLVGGSFYTIGGRTSHGVGRLGPDGAADVSFTSIDFNAYDTIRALATYPDGRVVAAGTTIGWVGDPRPGVFRVLSATGSTLAAPSGQGFTGAVEALYIETGGAILAGGAFTAYNGTAQPYLIRLAEDATLDSSFMVKGLTATPGGFIRALSILPDGRLMVGGSWLDFDGFAGRGLVLLEPAPEPPVIETHPEPRLAVVGESITLAAAVAGDGPLVYQWRRDDIDLPGATGATFAIPVAQLFHSGSYSLVVSGPGGHAVSNAATVTVSPGQVSSTARVMNLSTRALGLTGDNLLVPGFVIEGTGTKRMLIRAVGPGLGDFGLEGFMEDPRLVLKQFVDPEWVDVQTSDDWGAADNAAEFDAVSTRLGAFPLAPGSRDAAVLAELGPGLYTAHVTGSSESAGGGIGVALVELYDVGEGSGEARLMNLSNRGYVGTGADIMIPGFVVSEEGPKTFLIRAVGPGLWCWALDGLLHDPRLTIYQRVEEAEVPILWCDNWGENGDATQVAQTAAQVGAFELTEGSADAAFVVTLAPGVYSVHAAGKDGGTGIGMVEIYVVE